MPKKKTNYESKGFVRRIAGSIFSVRGAEEVTAGVIASGVSISDSKWRPRKNQFERLDGDDDEDDLDSRTDDHYKSWTIKNVFSTESDAGEYKREILYKRKQATLKHHTEKDKNKKRDLSSLSIKPPIKDTLAVRPNDIGSAKKAKKHKIVKEVSSTARNSSFEHRDSFGFLQAQGSVGSSCHDDETMSRYTASSKQSFQNHSHHTISSDPTDFFSHEMKLTSNNLERMAAMSSSTKELMNGFPVSRERTRGKFYQFTIDEDKESTVVESNIGFPLDFGIKKEVSSQPHSDDDDSFYDDDSEHTGVGSQKTKVQERNAHSRTKKFFFGSDHERAAAPQDIGIMHSNVHHGSIANGKGFDASFQLQKKPDGISRPKSTQAQDLHSSRQASAHSLSYSPSPVKNKKLPLQNAGGRVLRDERLPLSPLSNVKPRNATNTSAFLPPKSRLRNDNTTKPDPDMEWKPFSKQYQQLSTKPDPDSIFDVFGHSHGVQNYELDEQPKRRDPSLSSSFPEFNPEFPEDGSVKENPISHFKRIESHKKSRQCNWMDSGSNGEGQDKDDSFDLSSHGHWNPLSGCDPVGMHGYASGQTVTSYSSKGIEIDNKSIASYGNVSATESYTKPLGLPSNAIMASMLFRTHYNIDQQDVDEKIKAKEEENTKDKKTRRGDIPDSVHADYDYMTNVSSFSEDAPAALHEAWKKPSRDLLDYFTKSRSMQVDTRERLEKQRAKAKAALFEA